MEKVGEKMKQHKRLVGLVCLVLIISCVSVLMLLKEDETPVKLPSQKNDTVVPVEMTKSWYDSLTIPVENPELIETLNRSKYSSAFYTAGVEATIFLGRWLLTCEVSGIEPVPYFISGVNITGETTTADVYLKILKNAPRLTIKNIVKAAVDTTWIDKETFNVIN